MTDTHDAEDRIVRAKLVAEHWRKAGMEMLAKHEPVDPVWVTHSLGCVLAALDGGERPEDLGVAAESVEGRELRALEGGVR